MQLTKNWRSAAAAALLCTAVSGQHLTTVTAHLTVTASEISIPSPILSPNSTHAASGSSSTFGTGITRKAISLASPVIGTGSIRATVVTVTPTFDGSSTTSESAAALPTSSTAPLCETIYLDENNNQLSRIYCNANLLLGNLSMTTTPTTFDLCISICNELKQCVGAVFDNSSSRLAGSKGTCILKEIGTGTLRKRQSAVDLIWHAGTYVALKLTNIQAALPAAPTNSNVSSTPTSTASVQLIPSIQPALNLSTTAADTGVFLSTGVPFAASVSVTVASSKTSNSSSSTSAKPSSDPSSNASRLQATTSSSTEEVVRVTRVTRVTITASSTKVTTSSSTTLRSSILAQASTPTTSSSSSKSTTFDSSGIAEQASRSSSKSSSSSRSSSTTTAPASKSSSASVVQVDSSTLSRKLTTTVGSAPASSTAVPSAVSPPQTSSIPSSPGSAAIAPRLSNPILLGTGVDETQYGVLLPFNVSLYTQSSSNLTITTNGVLSLGSNTSVYEAYTDGSGTPPALPTGILIPGSAAVWWQYLESFSAAGLGVYYQVDNNNFLSIEWLMYDNSARLTNAVLTYSFKKPGSVTMYYFSDGDTGLNSSIGVQGLDTTNGWAGVTYETGKAQTVKTGLMLTFSTGMSATTSNGTVASTTFDPTCFPKGSFPKGTCGTTAT